MKLPKAEAVWDIGPGPESLTALDPGDTWLVLQQAASVQSTALWIYDFDTCTIPWANPKALEFWTAETVEELAARSLKREMSDNVARRLDQYREDFRNNPARIHHETWTLYPREQPVLIDCTFHCCVLNDGRICALVEGQPRNQPNAETQRAIDALLHSQVMTALYTEAGEELFANRAIRDVLGPGPLPFGHGFVDNEQRDAFLLGLEISGRHRDTVEVRTGHQNRWYDMQATRCRDAATGDQAFHLSATDITAQKAYERELEAARDIAEKADRAKSEFVASMSHEMRTPMNGVLGILELLSHTETSDLQKKYVEIARDSGIALLDLIEDVLDISSIELNAITLERDAVNLLELSRNVVDGLQRPAQRKGLKLNLETDLRGAASANGDPRRLGQIMRNLIGNAIKFTSTGEIALRLSREGESGLRVEVRDTGPGVPHNQHETIFKKFSQGNAGKSSPGSGVGLGLAICREIVQLMEGEIGVRNEPGGGACFWFTIPRTFEQRSDIAPLAGQKITRIET